MICTTLLAAAIALHTEGFPELSETNRFPTNEELYPVNIWCKARIMALRAEQKYRDIDEEIEAVYRAQIACFYLRAARDGSCTNWQRRNAMELFRAAVGWKRWYAGEIWDGPPH